MERIVWVVSRKCGQFVWAEITFKCNWFSQQTYLGGFPPECLTFKGNLPSPPIKLKVLTFILDYPVDGAGLLCQYIILFLNIWVLSWKRTRGLNVLFSITDGYGYVSRLIAIKKEIFKAISSLPIQKCLKRLDLLEKRNISSQRLMSSGKCKFGLILRIKIQLSLTYNCQSSK